MKIFEFQKEMQQLGAIISRTMAPDHDQSKLRVEVIKQTAISASCILRLGPQKAFAKVFNKNSEAARLAFAREHKALAVFGGKKMCPTLLMVAEPECLVMSEYVEGLPITHKLELGNLATRAERIGQWIGNMVNTAPKIEKNGDWADYLQNYNTSFHRGILETASAYLGSVTYSSMTLAKNDNALSNFIFGADKRVYGLDFEHSMFKPAGWDLAMATQAFFVKFPEDMQLISAAILKGYQLVIEKNELPADFDHLMNVVALSSARYRSEHLYAAE